MQCKQDLCFIARHGVSITISMMLPLSSGIMNLNQLCSGGGGLGLNNSLCTKDRVERQLKTTPEYTHLAF